MSILQENSLEELLAAYRVAAVAHTKGNDQGTPEQTNEAADRLAAIYQELRRRGPGPLGMLSRYLDDIHPGVRCWAAGHVLLGIDTERAEKVLRRLSDQYSGALGFNAQMILELWRKGELEFP
ncbi:MAG: hypothetical protein QNJ30_23540 [Kiloniellales bacterium]|nr:hypothetical protein [Kiloniellales bacterium]